uniref:Uncharacterized protein n=1 Tax=Nonomuraea gerenzanensis TaxID=93944 RepID=A0A1M4E581_9ACTN|nr:hypothetical protein BN4615_P3450 [Nonomuraea gerenzanensis]
MRRGGHGFLPLRRNVAVSEHHHDSDFQGREVPQPIVFPAVRCQTPG